MPLYHYRLFPHESVIERSHFAVTHNDIGHTHWLECAEN